MTKKTVADNAHPIVDSSITNTAAGAPHRAHTDDDQRWAETVIASLPSRSREARKALAEALLHGQPIAAPVGCAR